VHIAPAYTGSTLDLIYATFPKFEKSETLRSYRRLNSLIMVRQKFSIYEQYTELPNLVM
jgi:hypothetical protein